MPQRDELAKVAVTLHVRCQQRERRARRILRFVFRVSERLCPESRRRVSRHEKFGTQHYADNRFYFCFLRQLAKLYRCIQTIRIRQRHGGHVLLDRGGDNFFRRRHAAQKRVVTMTMQMYEHGCPGVEREEGMPVFRQACLFIQIR